MTAINIGNYLVTPYCLLPYMSGLAIDSLGIQETQILPAPVPSVDRENNAILEDVNGAGHALHKVIEGMANVAKNALGRTGFKDALNNFMYPITDADGKIVVTSSDASTVNYLRDEKAISGSLTETVVGFITLQNSKTYHSLGVSVSSRRDAIFNIYHEDNGTFNLLFTALVSSGFPTFKKQFGKDMTFTSGSTGTQKLVVKGYNQSTIADLRYSATIIEKEV